MAINFPDHIKTFDQLVIDDRLWAVKNTAVECIGNMTDEELRQAVVEDVLCATMWDRDHPHDTVNFGPIHLYRFIERYRHYSESRYLGGDDYTRVTTALTHPDVTALVHIYGGRIRIRPDKLLAAQEYCGVIYDAHSES